MNGTLQLSPAARALVLETIEAEEAVGDPAEAAAFAMLLKAHDAAGSLLDALREIAFGKGDGLLGFKPAAECRRIAERAIAKAEGARSFVAGLAPATGHETQHPISPERKE